MRSITIAYKLTITTAVLGALLAASRTAAAAPYQDLTTLSSENGQLNVLMVAAEHTQPNLPGFSKVKFWTYEVCKMSAPTMTACPGGTGHAGLGGVRLALNQDDILRVRLVNHLPAVDIGQVHHIADYEPLKFNPTNLHTHGLIVDPHDARNSQTDPYGDYILLELPPTGVKYPNTNNHGTAITHGHVDYLYDVEKGHPSGIFWFHPHLHGSSLNQVSAGMAGVITVGKPKDYCDDDACVRASSRRPCGT